MTDTRDSFVNVKPVIVADCPDAHQVWLDIGVQHFTVGEYHETKEEADWYANQLRKALLSASPGERDGVTVPFSTLRHWRELVDDNPRDLAPRMDLYLADQAIAGESK